jgi:hypothetical protein
MAELSTHDRALVGDFREAGVFKDVVDDRLPQPEGVILVACGDGDELPELLGFVQKGMTRRDLSPRTHLFTLNGGALLIPKDSPLNVGEGDVLTRHIAEAVQLKGITTVSLYVHAPCGKAGTQNLGLDQTIPLLFKAKQTVQGWLPGLSIACFAHIDKGKEGRRTYYVSRTAFAQFLQSPALS